MGNVLITGGAGFIGSHLADILVADEWGWVDKNITIIDNYSNINSGGIVYYLVLRLNL